MTEYKTNNYKKETKITNEKMALGLTELFEDFDPNLRLVVEKAIIDYYLCDESNDKR